MTSDGVPVTLPASLVQGSQAPRPVAVKAVGGQSVPQSSSGPKASDADALVAQTAQTTSAKAAQAGTAKTASATQQKTATATNKAELANLLAQLNKYLNDSGRSFEFRVAPQSRDQTIQEVNPSSGEVVAEFSASQFPALAKSLGVSGVLVDEQA